MRDCVVQAFLSVHTVTAEELGNWEALCLFAGIGWKEDVGFFNFSTLCERKVRHLRQELEVKHFLFSTIARRFG